MFSIRCNWLRWEEDPEQGFPAFLEWCIEVVGFRALAISGKRGRLRPRGQEWPQLKARKYQLATLVGPGTSVLYILSDWREPYRFC
jgi:hypothetical protein